MGLGHDELVRGVRLTTPDEVKKYLLFARMGARGGRGKREEGRGKREEGRGKRANHVALSVLAFCLSLLIKWAPCSLLPAPCSLLLAPCSPCSPCSCASFLANPNPAFNLLVFKYLHKQDLYLYPSKNIQSRKFIVLFLHIECEVYYLCHRQVFLVSSSFFVTLLLCLSRHPSTPSLKYIQFLPTT